MVRNWDQMDRGLVIDGAASQEKRRLRTAAAAGVDQATNEAL